MSCLLARALPLALSPCFLLVLTRPIEAQVITTSTSVGPASPAPQRTPLGWTDHSAKLAGVYPYGAVYALAVNANETRVYVGEGASIAAIDPTQLHDPNQTTGVLHAGLLTRIPVDATIIQLEPDNVPGGDAEDDYLYVAGGDFGLLKVNLNSVPTSPPSTPVDCPTCAVTVLEGPAYPAQPRAIGDTVNDAWCMDVAIVDATSPTPDLLLALFSNTFVDQPIQSGPPLTQSELYVYDLATVRSATGPIAPLRTIFLDPDGPITPALRRDAMAYSIAIDGLTAYVAMGTGGILKVNPYADFNQSPPVWGPDFQSDLTSWYSGGNCASCTCTQSLSHGFFEPSARVCSVAVAGGHLYAAADDRGLIDIALNQTWAHTGMTVSAFVLKEDQADAQGNLECHVTYARFVAAAVDGNQRHVVVGSGSLPARLAEGAPYFNFGRIGWELNPGGAKDDPNYDPDLANPGLEQLYRFDDSGSGTLTYVTGGLNVDAAQWGGLALAKGPASQSWSIYAQHIVPQFTPTDIPRGIGRFTYASGAMIGEYAGRGLSPFGGSYALVDPDLLLLPNEGPLGSQNIGWLKLNTSGATIPEKITEVTGTSTLAANGLSIVPFNGQWTKANVVPSQTDDEWIAQPYQYGWRFRRMTHGAPGPVEWWQVPAPAEATDPASSPDTTGTLCVLPNGKNCRLTGAFYISSTIDPRGSSNLLAMTRSGTREGLVLYDRDDLFQAATAGPNPPGPCDYNNCSSAAGNPAACWQNAQCWLFTPPALGDPTDPYPDLSTMSGAPRVLTTHPEIAPGWCASATNCVDRRLAYRSVYSWRSKVARVPVASGSGADKYFLVCAAGSRFDDGLLASGSPGVDPDAGKAQIVMFDLTNITQFPNQTLVGAVVPRVGLGPKNDADHLRMGQAIAVTTATLGTPDGSQHRTYAFVADFGGRVLAFDITTLPGAGTHPEDSVIPLAGVWQAPASTFDGYHENVSDIVVDDRGSAPILYASAMRLGIVRLRPELEPAAGGLYTVAFRDPRVINTPGLAHGLALRFTASGEPQLLVAEKNNGVRIYGSL
ncbi:MAG: hypothetical protein K8S98_02410 [Planctomycetes bacterium]|nr:hypothetical protein [Planctomycetota bacterium]